MPELDIATGDIDALDNEDDRLKEPQSEASDSDDSEASSSSSPTTIQTSSPKPLLKSKKPPAWTDPSDPPTVSLSAPRLRKLRDAPAEITLSGREYETRLRRQYERINPEPEWAAKARKAHRVVQDAEKDEDGIQDLLSSTAGILAPSQRKTRAGVVLPSGTLTIERLRDANQAAQGSGSGEVKVVAFHPSDKVPVLCVGTADRRIRLFNVS